jgi:Family of unknown function (DUF5681)
MLDIPATSRTRRPRGRPFAKGRSGNPAGRPPGSRNRATLAAEALLDGEAAALARQAVERALAGSDLALKLCLDRILPPRRERTVRFALPPIASAADLAAALGAVAAAVAEGALTPGGRGSSRCRRRTAPPSPPPGRTGRSRPPRPWPTASPR